MTPEPDTTPSISDNLEGMFHLAVCGVDGSDLAREAVRRAAALVEPDGKLVLVAANDIPLVVAPMGTMSAVYARLDGDTEQRLNNYLADAAQGAMGREVVMLPIKQHTPWLTLFEAVKNYRADLVAVGGGHHGRVGGILMGATSTEMVHRAPCSVLVARHTVRADDFPQSILVGVDGSESSASAFAIARAIATQRGSELHVLTSVLDDVDLTEVTKIIGTTDLAVRSGLAHIGLAEESGRHDLVVVGSSGRGGFRALGSVGERVAHDATCTVLIVRGRH